MFYAAMLLLSVVGLNQGAKLADETGDTIEKSGDASLKIAGAALIVYGVYFVYKKGLI